MAPRGKVLTALINMIDEQANLNAGGLEFVQELSLIGLLILLGDFQFGDHAIVDVEVRYKIANVNVFEDHTNRLFELAGQAAPNQLAKVKLGVGMLAALCFFWFVGSAISVLA